nr:glycosyltransferase family 2 protein [uncultured Oscillibacter sp.]
MEDQAVTQILELIRTLQEACLELYRSVETEQEAPFQQLCGDVDAGLTCILNLIDGVETEGNQKLDMICRSARDSFARMRLHYPERRERCLQKIEFECLPLLQEAYASYYFYQYLGDHPERLAAYEKSERVLLYGNPYIDQAVETGRYRYEVSLMVMAYNKLEYTKRCVESLLANIPKGLRYELILVNHGSSDGTKEYFEEIGPHKQLDIAVNGGGAAAAGRIVEGEYVIAISNDVVVTPHAIENLLACMRSDPSILWAVPATSNVSNFQAIPAKYSSEEELMEFARQNNRQDPFRWEQRVRLCNPIDIRRSSMWFATSGLEIYSWSLHPLFPGRRSSFPDDRCSLLIRRSGYKMMLVKDAYCHHFGSVTLRPLIQRQGEQEYYLEGRQDFARAYGVDPWGTGFCFDAVFMNRVVGEHTGHVEILGVNCGLGSNSLKIKEQVREYCRNPDVRLTNITCEDRFLKDLAGVSDEVKKIRSQGELKRFLNGKTFDYIVWEEPFPPVRDGQKMLKLLRAALRPGGQLLVKDCPAGNGEEELGERWSRLAV